VEWAGWEFVKRLNAEEGTGKYRLPTSAERELAAGRGIAARNVSKASRA
jgi:formylglycine-generating enzyme required for sulfatase activity